MSKKSSLNFIFLALILGLLPNYAVAEREPTNISIDQLKNVTGAECESGSRYRFSTTSEIQSGLIDVVVIIDENSVGSCITASDGKLNITFQDVEGISLDYVAITYRTVIAGTNTPIAANILKMIAYSPTTRTTLEIDRPTSLLFSEDSFLTFNQPINNFPENSIFLRPSNEDNRFSHQILSCGAGFDSEGRCDGAAVWDSNNTGISEVRFRVSKFSSDQNPITVSFQTDDTRNMILSRPIAVISGGPTFLRPSSFFQIHNFDLSGTNSFSIENDGQIVDYDWVWSDTWLCTGFVSPFGDCPPQWTSEMRSLNGETVNLPYNFTTRVASFLQSTEVRLVVTNNNGLSSIASLELRMGLSEFDQDRDPPIVTLLGNDTIYLPAGSTYVDAGVFALDGLDGELEATVSGSVDTNLPGEYFIDYTATDSSGNTGTVNIRRKVIVGNPDTTAPEITLLGEDPIALNFGEPYIDAGATAIDNLDGAVSIEVQGSVNTEIPGEYSLVYTATDLAGNTANVTRTVTVLPNVILDTTAPIVTVIGANPTEIIIGDSYFELGATAIDDTDGEIFVTNTGDVNTAEIGQYIISYSATDNAGNEGTATRTVNVNALDTPPVMAEGCPRGIFDDGNIYNSNAVLVENSCSIEGEVCPSQFFYGSNAFIDAVCTDGTWQRDIGDLPPFELEACPRGVFENGTMYSADLELVPNSCSNEAQICADQYFYASQSFETAVCSNGTWQVEQEACPRGIFGDGRIYNAQLELTENTCNTVGQICDDQYFYENQAYSQAVCTDEGWQEVENTQSLLPRSGANATLNAAPVSPKSNAVNEPISSGGSLGWLGALLLGLGATARRRSK